MGESICKSYKFLESKLCKWYLKFNNKRETIKIDKVFLISNIEKIFLKEKVQIVNTWKDV